MDDRIADDRDSTTIEVTDPVDLSVAVQYQPVGQRNNKEQWYEFPMSTDIIYLTTGRTYLLQVSPSLVRNSILSEYGFDSMGEKKLLLAQAKWEGSLHLTA